MHRVRITCPRALKCLDWGATEGLFYVQMCLMGCALSVTKLFATAHRLRHLGGVAEGGACQHLAPPGLETEGVGLAPGRDWTFLAYAIP